MHLITVAGPDRNQKAFVLADTLEGLISGAADELNFTVASNTPSASQYVVRVNSHHFLQRFYVLSALLLFICKACLSRVTGVPRVDRGEDRQ